MEQTKPVIPEQGPIKVVVVDEAKKKLKEERLAKIGDSLQQYGGKESDIPINSDYWNLVNQYRVE
jgi:hypothetical protein